MWVAPTLPRSGLGCYHPLNNEPSTVDVTNRSEPDPLPGTERWVPSPWLVFMNRVLNKLRRHDSADDALPSKPVNAMLDRLFGAEAGLIGRLPFPFGVSLIAVLRRPEAGHRPA